MRIFGISSLAAFLFLLPTTGAIGADQGSLDQGQERVLDGHGFLPSLYVSDPWVTTSFQNHTGGGMAMDLETPFHDLDGNELFVLKGDLFYATLGLNYQYGLGKTWAVGGSFAVKLRSGINTQTLVVEGANVDRSMNLWVKRRLVRTASSQFTLGLDWDYTKAFVITPQEFARSILDGEGLFCCATHVALKRLEEEFEQVVEEHHILGCEHLAVASLPVEYRTSEEGFVRAARLMSDLGLKLAEKGLTLSYHNHSFEFARFGGRTGLEILYQESDPQGLKAELDTYWVQHGGGSPSAWCRKLAGRLPLVHLKDMAIVLDEEGGTRQAFAEVGQGNLDWPVIIEACEAAGCQWYLVEQDVCGRPPLESLRISLEHLRSLGLK